MAKFKVPVSAHGIVVVEASDKDSAFEIAKQRATRSDANLTLDIDSLYRKRVSEVDNDRIAFNEKSAFKSNNEKAKAKPKNESPTNVSIPVFGSIDELAEARKQLGLNQNFIAEFLGVDSTTVSAWETEKSNISLSQAKEYAKLLRNYKDIDL